MQPGRHRVRVLVTTSHRPSQRVRSFAKDLASVLPDALKINRGKATLRDLYYDAVGYGAERVVVVTVWRGNPGTIRVYRPAEPPETGLREVAVIYMRGVTLRREIPGSQKIFHTSRLGVDATALSARLQELAEVLARAFLARLVVDEEKLMDYDVVLRLAEGNGIVAGFECPQTGRACGPRIRLASVVDSERGQRLP